MKIDKDKIVSAVTENYDKYSQELSLIDNDGWDTVFKENELEEIAKENNIDIDDIRAIIEEYREENIDAEEDKNKSKKKSKNKKVKTKKSNNNVGLIILIGVAVIVIAVFFFLKSLFNDNLNNKTNNKNNTVVKNINNNKKDNNFLKNTNNKPLVVETTTFLIKPIDKNNSIIKKEKKIDTTEKNKVSATTKNKDTNSSVLVKTDNKQETKKQPVQCFTKQEYIGKEIVYFLKNNNRYSLASESFDWNKKGIVLKEKLIGLDIDDKNRMIELDDKKWLPIEIFNKCNLIGQ